MELYLIRHAQSSNNALTDISTRVSDPELTPLGLQQAAAVARYLATFLAPEHQPEAISGPEMAHAQAYRGRRRLEPMPIRLYCSAMWRSLQTAHAIGEALGVTPEVWLDIHEQGGIYLDHGGERGRVGEPGKRRSEILASFPACQLPETLTDAGWWQGSYEELDGSRQRALRVAAELEARAMAPERLLLVSHGIFMSHLLQALFRQPMERSFYYGHYNTAMSHLLWRPDGELVVLGINRIEHLPADLLT